MAPLLYFSIILTQEYWNILASFSLPSDRFFCFFFFDLKKKKKEIGLPWRLSGRVCLPVWGTQVWSLVQKIPRPVEQLRSCAANDWAWAPGPARWVYWSRCLKTVFFNKRSHRQGAASPPTAREQPLRATAGEKPGQQQASRTAKSKLTKP